MNTRIQELAKDYYVRAEYTESGWQDAPKYVFDADDLQKFTALLIEECCGALNPMLRGMISRGHAVAVIKQHFGVE